MDSVSITKSCTSLLEGIGLVSESILDLIVSANEARRDVDGFSRELTSLHLCVQTLRDDDFAGPETLKGPMSSLLNDCDVVVREMNSFVQRHSDRKDTKRPNWTQSSEHEVSKLQERLKTYTTALDIALECVNLAKDGAGKNNTSIPEAKIVGLKSEISQFQSRQQGQDFLLDRFLNGTLAHVESFIESTSPIEQKSLTRGKPSLLGESIPLPRTTVEQQAGGQSSFNTNNHSGVDPPQYSTLIPLSHEEAARVNKNQRARVELEGTMFSGTRPLVPVLDIEATQTARMARAALHQYEVDMRDDKLSKLLRTGNMADETTTGAVRILLSQGARIGMTHSLRASQLYEMNMAMVSVCLKYGASLSHETVLVEYIQNCWRRSPSNMYDMVEFLLEQGANVNGTFPRTRSAESRPSWPADEQAPYMAPTNSALHMVACLGRWSSLIALLIAFGGDMHALSQGMETPLDVAIRYINIRGIRALVNAGASKINVVASDDMAETVRANLLEAMRRCPEVVERIAHDRGFKANIHFLKRPHKHPYNGPCKKCNEMRLNDNHAFFQSCEQDILQALGYINYAELENVVSKNELMA